MRLGKETRPLFVLTPFRLLFISKPSEVADAGLASFIVEAGHFGLGALGLIPGVGAVADLANAGLYAYEVRNTEAAWSLAAAVPGLGYAANTAKYAGKAGKLYQATRAIDVGVNLAESGYYVQQGLANGSTVQAGLGLFGLGANARAAAGLAGDGARAFNRNYEFRFDTASLTTPNSFAGFVRSPIKIQRRTQVVSGLRSTGTVASQRGFALVGEAQSSWTAPNGRVFTSESEYIQYAIHRHRSMVGSARGRAAYTASEIRSAGFRPSNVKLTEGSRNFVPEAVEDLTGMTHILERKTGGYYSASFDNNI